MRKLGQVQESLLNSLREHGYWYNGCGWLWDTPSHTTQLLETLVKRGLVKKGVTKMRFRNRDIYEPVNENTS